MSCDCFKKSEERIKEIYPEKLAPNEVLKEVNVLGYALIFGEKSVRFSIPVEIRYEQTTKNGVVKKKVKELPLLASFCPICGKPFKEEPQHDV